MRRSPKRVDAHRPIVAGLREQIKTEIGSMLQNNVIELVDKLTDWCSLLAIAPKSYGKIRTCIAALNQRVEREIYFIPQLSEMLSQFSKDIPFSKLHANSRFWQVLMEKKSKLCLLHL